VEWSEWDGMDSKRERARRRRKNKEEEKEKEKKMEERDKMGDRRNFK